MWRRFAGRATRLLAVVVLIAGCAASGKRGNGFEAWAMLERAVAAVREDKQAALAAFTAGKRPHFRFLDLYVFCADRDGVVTAHGADASMIGRNLREFVDRDGVNVGETLFGALRRGRFNSAYYLWPRPGETEPQRKVVYVTLVADQLCAVGFYR